MRIGSPGLAAFVNACEAPVSQGDLATETMLKRFDEFGAAAVECGRGVRFWTLDQRSTRAGASLSAAYHR
jgi:hypothetical protein